MKNGPRAELWSHLGWSEARSVIWGHPIFTIFCERDLYWQGLGWHGCMWERISGRDISCNLASQPPLVIYGVYRIPCIYIYVCSFGQPFGIKVASNPRHTANPGIHCSCWFGQKVTQVWHLYPTYTLKARHTTKCMPGLPRCCCISYFNHCLPLHA